MKKVKGNIIVNVYDECYLCSIESNECKRIKKLDEFLGDMELLIKTCKGYKRGNPIFELHHGDKK